MKDRKKDHIALAFESQTMREEMDNRFFYEPMLAAHPVDELSPIVFLGKTFRVPLWVSSMTGGTLLASKINNNLAQACKEFGFGMGLGSCRSLLENDAHFVDFDVRNVIGDELPLFANLGICQIEQMLENNQSEKINDLIKRLQADGLIIHVNPLQEWFQPEGEKIKHPPIETIKRLLDKIQLPLIVKEVGHGIGPSSLLELLKLPLAAIEFGAFGGTNFTKLEILRHTETPTLQESFEPLTLVGMDAYQMLEATNRIFDEEKNILCKQIIISGGISSYLDGYYLLKKSRLPAVYGQASTFLKYAMGDYEELYNHIRRQIRGLQMAHAYLRVKE
jgi:isopentenyl-diphosphate Delta-isomerase